MTLTEIKKELYKQKPIAKLRYVRKDIIYYETTINDNKTIIFAVPVNDIGDADFTSEMDAKLLIRWIVE